MTTTSGRLLISHITLRGPELAQVYAAVAGYPEATLDDLRSVLCPAYTSMPPELADAPLREALSFLTIVGMLDVQGRIRRYTAQPLEAAESFRLALLRRLRSHPDPRQQAISLVQRMLVTDDTLAVVPSVLRTQIERSALRDLFAWTGEKVYFWSQLAAFMGLVRRPERIAEVIVLPQPQLLCEALHWAQIRLRMDNTAEGFSLATALYYIDDALFACFTERGRLHQGLIQSLVVLEQSGAVKFFHHADAAYSVLLGERRVSTARLLVSE